MLVEENYVALLSINIGSAQKCMSEKKQLIQRNFLSQIKHGKRLTKPSEQNTPDKFSHYVMVIVIVIFFFRTCSSEVRGEEVRGSQVSSPLDKLKAVRRRKINVDIRR